MKVTDSLASETWDPSTESHSTWRHRRALEGQRYRRSRSRRIDFYASKEANAIIDGERTNFAGGDASSIINRIVVEWAGRSGIK